MPAPSQPALPPGIRYLPGQYDPVAQAGLVEDIRGFG